MRKIIISVIMLMLAFAALCTSTYAWFSIKKSVEINNLEIDIANDKSGLLIYENDTWKNKIDGTSLGTLLPVTTYQGASWHVGSYSGDYLIYEDITDLTDYVIIQDYQIKTANDESLDLYLDSLVVDSDDEIFNALRIGVLYDNHFYVFNKDLSQVTYPSTDTSHNLRNVTTSTTETKLGEVSDTESDVSIYIWFEGNDDSCSFENFSAKTSSLKVSIKFRGE